MHQLQPIDLKPITLNAHGAAYCNEMLIGRVFRHSGNEYGCNYYFPSPENWGETKSFASQDQAIEWLREQFFIGLMSFFTAGEKP